MTERRSLSTALEITPEKMAFIESKPSPPPQVHRATQEENQSLTKPSRPKATKEDSPRQNTRNERPELSLIGTPLIPLTTRLQAITADALRRAYLERKLRNQSPHTQ